VLYLHHGGGLSASSAGRGPPPDCRWAGSGPSRTLLGTPTPSVPPTRSPETSTARTSGCAPSSSSYTPPSGGRGRRRKSAGAGTTPGIWRPIWPARTCLCTRATAAPARRRGHPAPVARLRTRQPHMAQRAASRHAPVVHLLVDQAAGHAVSRHRPRPRGRFSAVGHRRRPGALDDSAHTGPRQPHQQYSPRTETSNTGPGPDYVAFHTGGNSSRFNRAEVTILPR
jgi:hypothetical protein